MCELRDFDIQCRGVASLADEWQGNHRQVRKVWKLEDLVAICNSCANKAIELYDEFRTNPESDIRFSHFVSDLEGIMPAFNRILQTATVLEDEGYPVRGLNDLSGWIAKLDDIVQEDRFATDSAFAGGALDDWE